MNISKDTLKDIIEILLEKFPNRIPKKEISTEQMHILIGNQQVIDYLIANVELLEKR